MFSYYIVVNSNDYYRGRTLRIILREGAKEIKYCKFTVVCGTAECNGQLWEILQKCKAKSFGRDLYDLTPLESTCSHALRNTITKCIFYHFFIQMAFSL